MQIPQRRAQKLRKQDEGPLYLTPAGVKKLERELKDLERQQPEAIEDVDRTKQLGDFSENAEYQDAKFRLRRINDRIFSIKEKLKHVVVIQNDANDTGQVQLGSTVVLRVGGKEKTYQIVGPAEVNPSRGRISHVSPLGSELIGRMAGEKIILKTEAGAVEYEIVEVR